MPSRGCAGCVSSPYPRGCPRTARRSERSTDARDGLRTGTSLRSTPAGPLDRARPGPLRQHVRPPHGTYTPPPPASSPAPYFTSPLVVVVVYVVSPAKPSLIGAILRIPTPRHLRRSRTTRPSCPNIHVVLCPWTGISRWCGSGGNRAEEGAREIIQYRDVAGGMRDEQSARRQGSQRGARKDG